MHAEIKSQTSLVGRERELAAFDEALEEALKGRGRLVLLSGEPGIGKTRLADELSELAVSRGACVVWGRCWEGAGAPAYWPILQIVRALIGRRELASALSSLSADNLVQIASIVPELRQLAGLVILGKPASLASDPEKARFELFDSVARLLKAIAQVQPLVLVFDDLHDADQSSLQMLTFVAKGLKDSRAMIVGTHRDAEVRRSPELGKHIGELHREGATLPLGGLSRMEVGEFVESRTGRPANAGLLDKLHAATGGNPLFVGGVVRLMLADPEGSMSGADFKVPDEVRESIRHRLAALPGHINETLSIAAAIGNEFESVLVKQVLGETKSELLVDLEVAERAGIIARIGDAFVRWRFGHALIRSALYENLGVDERAHIHRQIGEVIERHDSVGQNSRIAELARHFVAGGVTDKAIDYSIAAGEAAARVFAVDEAAAHYERAVDLMKAGDFSLRRRASLLTRLGDAFQWTDAERAVTHWEEALAQFEALGDAEQAGEVSWLLGFILSSQRPSKDPARGRIDDLPRAEIYLAKAEAVMRQRARAKISGPGLSIGLAHFLFTRANVARAQLRIGDALRYLREALVVTEKENDLEVWCAIAAFYGMDLCAAGYVREADDLRPLLAKRIAIVDSKGWTQRGNADAAVGGGGGQLHYLGDLPGALQWWGRASASLLDGGQRRVLTGVRAYACQLMGDLVLARQLYAEVGGRPSLYTGGDWQGSWQALKLWTETAKPATLMDSVYHYFDSARSARALGLHQEACTALRQFLTTIPPDNPHPLADMHIRPELALHYLEMGKLDAARQQVSYCEEIVAKGGDWRGLLGHVAFAAGAVAAAEDNYVMADGRYASAIEIYKRFKLAWQEADALHYWGRALFAAGEAERASEKFDLSIECYRRMGAGQPWIDRVAADRAKTETRSPTPMDHLGRNACTFQREGDFWTISHRDKTFRLKDMKGLHYIAHLLAHPGQQFHVHDLTIIVDGVTEAPGATSPASHLRVANDLGDAGPVLDARAKAEYRKRRDELRAELAEAECANDIGRTDRVRTELEMLEDQLSAAVGLSGRARKASVHAERARMRIGKAIRVSLSAIRESDPVLWHHFDGCIRTGFVCGYTPDPYRPLRWQL
jgi:tetratricopeptide (TPR) repeat protein